MKNGNVADEPNSKVGLNVLTIIWLNCALPVDDRHMDGISDDYPSPDPFRGSSSINAYFSSPPP